MQWALHPPPPWGLFPSVTRSYTVQIREHRLVEIDVDAPDMQTALEIGLREIVATRVIAQPGDGETDVWPTAARQLRLAAPRSA